MAQIRYAGGGISDVETQDEQFTGNVVTVMGYIAVQRMSIWDLADVFSLIHPTIFIVILIILG